MDESDIEDIKNKVDEGGDSSHEDNDDLGDDDSFGDDEESNPFGDEEEVDETIGQDGREEPGSEQYELFNVGDPNITPENNPFNNGNGGEEYAKQNNGDAFSESAEPEGGDPIDDLLLDMENGNNNQDNLDNSKNSRIFDENNDNMIQELVDSMFNSEPSPTVPVKEPVVKPGTSEPYTKPIKPSQKPFSPSRRIHEDPQPKAKL